MAASVGAVVVAGVYWFWILVPYPWTLADRNPETTALMEQRVREARDGGDTLVIRREWVPLSAISTNLRRAVIVAEDYRFREHRGVDWVSLAEEVEWTGDDHFRWWSPKDLVALGRALVFVVRNRDRVRGRSTLTQQLAKNLYYGTDRSFVRKALEMVVAHRLERRLDKDRILELYLNVVEWGPGLFGAEAASRHYFGIPAGQLSPFQAATLAGTLPHPLTSNPDRNPGRMRWRRGLILGRLRGGPPVPAPLPLPDTAMVTPRVPDSAVVLPPPAGSLPDVGPDTVRVEPPVPDTRPAGIPAQPDTVTRPPDTLPDTVSGG